jgi:hypothetical protein
VGLSKSNGAVGAVLDILGGGQGNSVVASRAHGRRSVVAEAFY